MPNFLTLYTYLAYVCPGDPRCSEDATSSSGVSGGGSAVSGGGGAGVGSITLPTPELLDVGGLLRGALFVAYAAAAVFFLVQLLIGGLSWINAGGDPKNLESSRNRITNAVIGLIIVMGAFAVTLIITTILGVNIFGGGAINIIPTATSSAVP